MPEIPKQQRSDWNRLVERIRLHPSNLTATEYRVIFELAHQTAGYARSEASVGRRMLLQRTGLQDRDFERALKSLVVKGLVFFTPGSVGRGHRAKYRLLLDAGSFAAVAAEPTTKGKPHRLAATASVAQAPRIQAEVVDAFRSTGGQVELGRNRQTLTQQAGSLLKKGVPREEILAAARELGRTPNGFGGNLTAKVIELKAAGGACAWAGVRQGLSPSQLRECGCRLCQEWADVFTAPEEVPA